METTEHTEVYPPPPPWYKLYSKEADGSAERPLPPLPPPPIEGEYQVFGVLDSADPGVPPLSVKQLFEVQPNGAVDFKKELGALNEALLTEYLKLIETLIERPSSYGREVESIGTITRNMHYLLNYLRCHQARASLEHVLRTEAGDRRDAIADLRKRRSKAEQDLADVEARLAELVNPALQSETMP